MRVIDLSGVKNAAGRKIMVAGQSKMFALKTKMLAWKT